MAVTTIYRKHNHRSLTGPDLTKSGDVPAKNGKQNVTAADNYWPM
jgi:hypothetical protein